jgi:hypothetical protein
VPPKSQQRGHRHPGPAFLTPLPPRLCASAGDIPRSGSSACPPRKTVRPTSLGSPKGWGETSPELQT